MKKNLIVSLKSLFCLLLIFGSSQNLRAQLAGNYTIDPNKLASATNYLNFTSAVSDLVSGTRSDGGSKNGPGVSAAVVFNVAEGTYNEAIKITAIIGVSALNTVTFQSDPKNLKKPKIEKESVTVIHFERTSFITIKGITIASYNAKEDLIIATDSCTNLNIIGNYIAASSYNTKLIMINPSQGGTLEGPFTSNNIIRNNSFAGGHIGIYLMSGKGDSIEKNNIQSTIGITATGTSGITIQNNNFSYNQTGILLGDTKDSCKILKNFIHIYELLASPYPKSVGIDLLSNESHFDPYKFIIANNLINISINTGTNIGVRSISHSASIYNNNIYIYSKNDSSRALQILGGGPSPSINLLNNNIEVYNKGVAIEVKTLNGWQIIECNNNNFYAPFGDIGQINSIKYKTLTDFQNASNTDGNSITVAPFLIYNTNYDSSRIPFMFTRNGILDGKGKSISAVTDDFEGKLRSLTAPDIGANEFTPVWPGDANNDKISNVLDVLYIGIAYNSIDTVRFRASSGWTPQIGLDWKDSFKNGLNFHHADCNGDGKVDVNDLQPILLNYGKTHNKTSLNKTGTPNDPALYVQFPKDSFLAGDTVTADLYLGTNNISVSNGYGFAFSLNYNPKYIDSGSFTIDFSNSWFGKKDTDIIYLVHDDYNNGQMDIGITRINQKNVSGYGKIGTCSFVLQENIAAKRWIEKTITLEPSDVIMISADETEIPIFTIADSIKAQQFVGINKTEHNAEKEIRIYPNPVQDILTIDAAGQKIKEVKIMNMLGQVLYVKQNQASQENIIIPTAELPKGIYNVIITTEKGISGRLIARQ